MTDSSKLAARTPITGAPGAPFNIHRPPLHHCCNCGARIERLVPPGDSHLRAVCPACGGIHYENPKVVVGCIPVYGEQILLCKRAIEPRYGYWTLPAGFMENDESTGQAASRETLEEAGARIELGEPFSMLSVPQVNQVHLFYRARLLDLNFAPGEETLELALLKESEVPWQDVAFRTVGLTLKHYFADRARGVFGFHAGDIPPR